MFWKVGCIRRANLTNGLAETPNQTTMKQITLKQAESLACSNPAASLAWTEGTGGAPGRPAARRKRLREVTP